MSDLQTSSRRILASYGRGKADRIPVTTPISWSPTADIDRDKPGGWRATPAFAAVARRVQALCDPMPTHSPVALPRVFSRISYQRFLEAPDEYTEALPVATPRPGLTRHTTALHTPKGDLFWWYDEEEGIETRWDTGKPVNSLADVDRMLSVPYRFDPPPAANFDAFRKYRAAAGPLAIGGGGINSMVAMLVGMIPYELVLEWMAAEPQAIRALADAWLERTRQKVEFLLDQGAGPFWHFNGVERACPPMMGPRQWEEWVVPYDGAIMKLIKARDPQSLIHVHCHGKVGTLLRSFREMGVDSTDPLEPPPQGDVTMAEARRLAGPEMTLYGNIQFLDMERGTPDQIEELVRRAIGEGGPRMRLHPSAAPHEAPTPQFFDNAHRYLDAAEKYGGR
jgi:uroporphyrinogen-III decarboxylase